MVFSKLNRKADAMPVQIIVVMFIVATILIIMFTAIYKLNLSTTFEKKYLAADISQLIDSMYTLKGDSIIEYPGDTKNFSFSFTKNKVTVYDHKKSKTIFSKVAYFHEDKDIEFKYAELKPDINPVKLVFKKTGNIIEVVDGNKEEAYTQTQIETELCPSISTIIEDSILIDPGHGVKELRSGSVEDFEKDYGFVNPGDSSFYESKSMIRLANALGSYISTKHKVRYNKDVSPGVNDIYLDNDARLEKAAEDDIIISLHTGKNDLGSETAVIYYSLASKKNKQSEKLACNIMNQLRSYEKLSDIEIRPIANPSSDPDPYLKILNNDNIHLFIEIGNMNIEKKSNFLAKDDELYNIANLIGAGVFDYGS